MFLEKEGKLIYSYDGETVCIEAWGKDALRVRATKNRSFTGRDWALEAKDAHAGEVEIFEDPSAKGGAFANMYEGTDTSYGKITNGKLHAVIDSGSVITFYHEDGRVLLKEHFRRLRDEESMPLNIMGREYSNGVGDNFRIVARFVARKGEKIFGMGQYQQHELDLKGCMLELAQRNSQVSVPFYLSSIGYGFLWNNPGVGQVMFANNGTEWVTESGKEIDYLVIAGDTPAEIEENYMTLTGKPPMMPEYGMGFWQCKLRYWNQEQLLSVARKYKELGVPLDVIVVDFFHWTKQGEFKFDPKYWPDVPGMCRELKEMGIQVVVSVWPTVDIYSENFEEMKEKGYLVRTEHGVPLTMLCGGNEVFFDATNPDGKHLIILHTKGSHFNYTQRYPRSFAQWKPECIGVDSGCTKAQMINSYDNSVTYVDHFISSVIDQVRDKKAIVFYAADHGESINEREHLHGTPRELAPPEQFRVPMMVWMSDKYLENPANAQAFAQLKKEADMKVPRRHVELYDTIMGCLGYTSPDGGINENNNWCHIPQAKEAAAN